MKPALSQNKMGSMPVGKLLVNMSLPIMASMLIQALYNIVDSIYVAQYSKHALTALTLAFPVQLLLTSVIIGTSVGVNSLVSRRLGAGEQKQADKAATNGIVLVLLSSIVFIALGLFFTKTYYTAVVSPESDPLVVVYGCDYLSVVMSMSFSVALAILFEKLLQATGKTVLSMITQGVGAIINIFLDPILIFGRYGFEPMGARGAAIATVIGQLASMTVGLVFVVFFNKAVRLRISGLLLEWRTVCEIYRVGLPSIIMQSIGSLTNLLLNGLLIAYSDTAVAVLGAYGKLISFALMPLFGLNSGVVPIVGFNYGAKLKHRITKTVRFGLIMGMCITAVAIIVVQIIPDRLLALFDADEAMMAIGIPAFRISCLCMLPAAGSIILSGCFSGIGLGMLSLISAVIRNIAILIPCAYLLSALFGLNAIWWAYLISESISLIISVVMYRGVCAKHLAALPDEPVVKGEPVHA